MKRSLVLIAFFTLIAVPGLVHAVSIAERVSGRILLDVERHGEAWYVNPVDLRRYYLGRPDDALRIMRELGLGITNQDLNRIAIAGEHTLEDEALARRLAGRILLQVEAHGEAWYVHPVTLQRHYLGRPSYAYEVMRYESLGITSADLSQIKIANLENQESYIVVPFVAQAPFAEWGDMRQQEGCEEASVFMAMKWVREEWLTNEEARAAILAMSDWQEERWGYYHDTSAQDTADRLFNQYYGYYDIEVEYDISTQDIRDELLAGNIVLITINGQTIGNPYYTGVGPLRHMIIVTGFDAATREFITNDPGTRFGQNIRFSEEDVARSLRDYNSGEFVPITTDQSAMIVVKK